MATDVLNAYLQVPLMEKYNIKCDIEFGIRVENIAIKKQRLRGRYIDEGRHLV